MPCEHSDIHPVFVEYPRAKGLDDRPVITPILITSAGRETVGA